MQANHDETGTLLTPISNPKRKKTRNTSSIKRNVRSRMVANSLSMYRTQAFEILGLQGQPSLSEINIASNKMLSVCDHENGGNPRKYELILQAKELLISQQRDVLELYKTYITTCDVDPDSDNQKKSDIKNRVNKLKDLSLGYLEDMLQESYVANDIKVRKAQYNRDFSAECLTIMRTCSQYETRPNFLGIIESESSKVKVSLDVKDIDLPFAFSFRTEPARDPICIFESQSRTYLDDILALAAAKQKSGRYARTLENLHKNLNDLSDEYVTSLKSDPNKDELLSKAYAEKFQALVTAAKLELAQEPGIWANLNPCLRGLFTVLFFIKYFISLAEDPQDRFNMFQSKKIDIQEQYDKWMEKMPELGKQSTPRGFGG